MPRHLTGETAVQCSVIARLRAAGVLCAHVKNEGKKSKRVASLDKAQGVLAGVPDILIFDPPPLHLGFVGTALELKVDRNKPSEAQSRLLNQLAARRWLTGWRVGEEQAIEFLKACGYL